MKISPDLVQDATQWRHTIHANPELGFEEHDTADLIAGVLEDAGIEVHRGLAGTGVVGVLRKGSGGASIGLRADIDALPIVEQSGVPYASAHDGRMHACGHDGHTSILLGAAVHLARHGEFNGTVYFYFQPAEENLGGGKLMVEEGLFEQFDADEVYGLHNWPGMPLGEVCINDGVMMGSFDIFDIIVTGRGAHAAMPHLGRDPIVAASELVTSLQTLVSRRVSPLESAVLTITQFQAGSTYNVIPESVHLRGTIRALSEDVRLTVKEKFLERVESLAGFHECTVDVNYQDCYPATINDPEAAASAREVLRGTFGADTVVEGRDPSMASEDFAFMLNEKKGAYIWLGVDEPGRATEFLHSPKFDFNDNALPLGIELWVDLVEKKLA